MTRRPRRGAPAGKQVARANPEREVAFRTLRRVDGGAFADRAFASEARRAGLSSGLRGRAMRLAYGAVQRRRTLDWALERHLDRPDRVEDDVRAVLRLAAYDLMFSDGIPISATVDQAVRLARSIPGAPARRSARGGLVNAVLRRTAEDLSEIHRLLDDPEIDPGVRFSFPDWMVEALRNDLGDDDAFGVMAAANEPAESALRWNPLRGPRVTVTNELGVPWHGDSVLSEAIVLDAPVAFEETAAWQRGRAMPQSRASMLPARALDPQPGERVLDLCAAPGAKATHLAALTRNAAEVVCVELHEARARALEDLGRRMGARLEVVVGDGREVALTGRFDAILVDAPCTGTGVLSARPDARWRRRQEAVAPLGEIQRGLLDRALELLHPRGRAVYSTCSLLTTENEDVVTASGARVEDLTQRFPGFAHPTLSGALRTMPHVHGTDGFFVCLINR